MLKKVHIPRPSDTSSTEKKQVQCSVCKAKAKSILYVCESGHIICKSCQRFDATIEGSNEGGDYKAEMEFGPDNGMKQLKLNAADIKVQDLASGDHVEAKKEYKKDGTLLISKEHCSKSNIGTTVEYKNPYFQGSSSSLTAYFDCSKPTETIEKQICNIVPRPVVCPVTICSKVVTIDSFILHFHFDHSKVPRTILDDIKPQEVSLKLAHFSTKIQCVATFIMETQKRSSQTIKKRMESITSVRNSMKDNKFLLLMAVRFPTNPVKLLNVKRRSSRIFTKSIHTQTEKNIENESEICTEYRSKSSSDYKSCITSRSVLDEDEVLLLWLCKLDDAERVFSITLLGEDKKRGYCFIGDAVHIKDKQDPSLLYDRSECLIVKGSAINRLYNLNGQITAIVSIIG